jgi:hypothetical protein
MYDLESDFSFKLQLQSKVQIKPTVKINDFRYPFVMFYYWLTAMMFFLPYQLYKICGYDDVKAVVAMLQNPVGIFWFLFQ